MTHPLELKAQEVAEQRLVNATESMWEDLYEPETVAALGVEDDA